MLFFLFISVLCVAHQCNPKTINASTRKKDDLMKAFRFIPENCDLCRKCEEACAQVCGSSKKPSGTYVPHIRVMQSPEGPYLRLCKHCEDAPCVIACPPYVTAVTSPPALSIVTT